MDLVSDCLLLQSHVFSTVRKPSDPGMLMVRVLCRILTYTQVLDLYISAFTPRSQTVQVDGICNPSP